MANVNGPVAATGFATVPDAGLPSAAGGTFPDMQDTPPSAQIEIIGDDDPDALVGGPATGLISGRGGNDFLLAPSGDTTLEGGDGDDTLTVRGGDHVLLGEAGDDWLNAGTGRNTLDGGDGDDTVSYADLVVGISLDLVQGAVPHGPATDSISNVENAVGGAGDDTLIGDREPNRLEGGPGRDVITGRGSADTFAFTAQFEGEDRITDFTHGTDRIAVARSGFGLDALPEGTLAPSRLAIGDATGPDQRFIYDPASGDLSFDADGNGPSDEVPLAHLGVPDFTAGDLVLF